MRIVLPALCLLGFGVCAPQGASADVDRWLRGLQISLPYLEIPGPVNDIERGNCSGLSIGALTVKDLGQPQVPKVGLFLSGVELRCQLKIHGMVVFVDFGLTNTAVNLVLEVRERQTAEPHHPLPLGPVHVTECQVTAHLAYLEFTGESIMQPMLEELHDSIRKIIDMNAPSFACSRIQSTLAEHASQVTERASSLLVPFVGAEVPEELPQAVAPLTDWASYPPLQVIHHLVAERPGPVRELLALASPLVIPVLSTVSAPTRHVVTSQESSISTVWSLRSMEIAGLETLEEEVLSVDGTGSFIDLLAAFRHVTVRVGADVEVESVTGKIKSLQPIRSTVNFTLALTNTSFAFRVLAMLSKPALDSLYVDQLQKPSCYAACAHQAASPGNSSLGVWKWDLDMTPELHLEVPGATPAFTASVSTIVAIILRGYTPSLEALLEGWVQVARKDLEKVMWEGLNLLPACGPTQIYLGPGEWASRSLLFLGLGLMLSGIVAAVLPPKYLCQLMSSVHNRVAPASTLWYHSEEGGNLASQRVVPQSAVWVFPLLALSAIVLFLYADLCIATSINFVFSAKGETLAIGPALAFSVVICAVNAFMAKAYLIAICIGLLSILWPFVKLALLVLAWQAPTSWLSVKRRGQLLQMLDEYGKWSLIDTWLGILALACYRLEWRSEGGDARFFVDPVPNMPFFVFVLASVLTLILGHVASGYHRQAVEVKEPKQRLGNSAFPLCTRAPQGTAVALTLGPPLLAALILVGAFTPSFQMVESGALSTLLLPPEARISKYSLVDLGLQMTRARSDNIGLRLVQLIFFSFSLVIPVVLQVVFVFLWLLPLTPRRQSTLIEFCQALDAWAAFDVFAVAVTVSHFEFGLFSTFLMRYNNLRQGCTLVKEYLHTECFHMECSLTSGFVALAGASLLSYAGPKFALRACRRALEECNEEGGSSSGSDEDEGDEAGSPRSRGSRGSLDSPTASQGQSPHLHLLGRWREFSKA